MDSIRAYFRDSIAYREYNGSMGEGRGLNDFDTFARYVLKDIRAINVNDPLILGFDESYIDTTSIDTAAKWLRISVNPCFRVPYCLILQKKKNGRSILTLKFTDGYGGYYSGYLSFLNRRYFSDSLYDDISAKLRRLDFWHLKGDSTNRGGLDGETWTFEAIENGKYNLQTRWVPQRCGNAVTKQLAEIGAVLRREAGFTGFLHLVTGISESEIRRRYQ